MPFIELDLKSLETLDDGRVVEMEGAERITGRRESP